MSRCAECDEPTYSVPVAGLFNTVDGKKVQAVLPLIYCQDHFSRYIRDNSEVCKWNVRSF